MTTLIVHPSHEVRCEIYDLLELLGLKFLFRRRPHEEVCEPASSTPQVPDVYHWGSELDMAHPLPAHFGPSDLYATSLADDTFEPNPLVLTAVALPVTGGTKNLLTEQPLLLRPERSVVDCLRLFDLTVRPTPNVIGGSKANTQLVEVIYVQHLQTPLVHAKLILEVRTTLGAGEVDTQLLRSAIG